MSHRLQTVEEETQSANPKGFTLPTTRLFSRITSWGWHRLGLLGILTLAAFLDLFRLEELGYSNEYYASAVKSMLASWPNFFFGSFDPAGFISVDKPPLFLWVQTAFAWLLGFSGISLLLPQVFAGVLSVALLYKLVGRAFGTTAGLLAALALAVTPIFVVMSRHTNPESLLILVLLLQVYALTRAVETGRLRWLLALAGLAGLGFNLKMLEAFVTLPVFYAVYFLMGRDRPPKRILQLMLVSVVVLAVSLVWALLVDRVPADQRPFVGGSTDNTVINLVFAYNGLSRVGPGGDSASSADADTFSTVSLAGQPGPLRLLVNVMAGETNWFFPLVLFGLVVLFSRFKGNGEGWRNPRNTALLTWTGWLVMFWLVFSFSKGIIHPYYLVLLAPPLAALFGAGLVALWQEYSGKGWRCWLLPGGLFVNTLYQGYILSAYSGWNYWVMQLAGGAGMTGVIALVFAKRYDREDLRQFGQVLLVGDLIAPLTWCVKLWYVTPLNPTLPSARPGFNEKGFLGNRYVWDNVPQPNWSGLVTTILPLLLLVGVALLAVWKWAGRNKITSERRKIFLSGIGLIVVVLVGGFAANLALSSNAGAVYTAQNQPVDRTDAKLASYLTANQSGWAYLVAVPTTSDAAGLILETGQPVLAVGGFMGIDPAMSPAQAQILVQKGKLRFFLVSPDSSFDNFDESAGVHAIYTWASKSCRPLDPALWKSNSNDLEKTVQEQLFDCGKVTP